MTAGPNTGGQSITAPSPVAPSIAERMNNSEQRIESVEGRVMTLERMSQNLVAEVCYLREQLGLVPLAPDHFS